MDPTLNYYTPTHYQQSNSEPNSPRRNNSAPNTPLMSEFILIPNDGVTNDPSNIRGDLPLSNGGVNPITNQPMFNAYSITKIPDGMNLKSPYFYQATPGGYPGGSIQFIPSSPAHKSIDNIDKLTDKEVGSWFLCQLCCRFFSRKVTRSVKTVSYDGGSDAGEVAGVSSSFKDFAENTTMHGIKYVVLPGARITIKRVLWTLVFALFWVYFISVGVKKVQYYYSFQHITQLDEESVSLPFPAITICNLNPIRLSAFESSDLYNTGLMYGILNEDLTLKEDLFSDTNPTTQRLRQKTTFSDIDKKKPFDLEEFMMRAGHKMKDMLKACKWRDIICTYKDFTPILTEMGLCYQYNVNKTWDEEKKEFSFKRVYKGGAGNGLKLLLVTQEDDYLPPKIEDFDSSLETGFKIQIHDADVPPLVHQLGLGLSPGLQTFVVLQKEVVQYLGAPWGECIEGTERVQNFTKYSDPACRIECETQHIVDECQCRLPFMPIISTLPDSNKVCSPTKYLSCAQERLAKIEDGEACGPEYCTKSCQITRYKSSMSSVKFPSYLGAIKLSEEYGPGLGASPNKTDGGGGADGGSGGDKDKGSSSSSDNKLGTNNKTSSYWKEMENLIAKQALVVSIYFQSLSLQRIDQVEAYDFAAMLGDIGGLMGLFIGASAMTLFEFLFFFCDSLILRRKGGRSCGGGDEEKNENENQMGDGNVGGEPLKNMMMAPGAVDGSKFVFNVNPGDNEYNAAMSRFLPQFSAHPLHNTFQQQNQPQQHQQQQQQPRGYSPLMKRGNSIGVPQGQQQNYMGHPNDGSSGMPQRDASSYPTSPIPPNPNGQLPPHSIPMNESNIPQNLLVTSYPPGMPGSGGKIFLANNLPQERYC